MRYQPITSYTELPPRWRIIEPEDGSPNADRYLASLGRVLQASQAANAYTDAKQDDLLAMVFANQTLNHELRSRQLALLITERQAMTRRHLADIHEKVEELRQLRPIRSVYAFNPREADQQWNQIERLVLDLQRQERDLQTSLWRDTLEIRQTLMDEVREKQATDRRLRFLGGGSYASA